MPARAAAATVGERMRAWRAGLAAALAFAVLVGLGTWQLQRLAWKRALIARIEAGLAAPPVPLPAQLDDPAAWEYRRVALAGRFDHAAERYVYAIG
ncbi:MAG: SURF1 family protein, partial [Alphaproteobacteria bacterium]